MSLITLFIPGILLLNTTNINLAYYHSWSGIGEYYMKRYQKVMGKIKKLIKS